MAVEANILVILGPTASGKSDLAMTLARKTGAEILSVDSMQVYRGMNIGTAKPTAAEQAEVKHHLIDVAEPDENFTVARFVEMADEVIRDAAARGVPLIATGGTPLYYKSLFEGLFDGPGEDAAVRERLRAVPPDELHRKLSEIDPPAAARIHLNDTRRLVRALEVFELTGKPISSFQTAWESASVRHSAMWVGLSREKEALNRRINARVKAMMTASWLDEVRALVAKHQNLSRTAGEATGYRELIDHLSGKWSLDEAVEQIKIATRQLARRQMKWFKRFSNTHWIPGDRAIEESVAEVLGRWKRP